MKKLIAGSLIALSLIINLQADSSEVKAEIQKECMSISVTSSVNLGDNINPLETQTNTHSWAEDGSLAGVAWAYWTCTKSTSLRMDVSSENNYKLKKAGTSEEIPYYFYGKNGRTFYGTGNPADGSWGVKAAINNTIKPGHYTDIITYTFTW